jgi:hypothetical protein
VFECLIVIGENSTFSVLTLKTLLHLSRNRFWILDFGFWILDFGFWIAPVHKRWGSEPRNHPKWTTQAHLNPLVQPALRTGFTSGLLEIAVSARALRGLKRLNLFVAAHRAATNRLSRHSKIQNCDCERFVTFLGTLVSLDTRQLH